jgi:Tfp pilus assembly protein PilF
MNSRHYRILPLIGLQLLLVGCAGVRFYEPIADVSEAPAVLEATPVEEKTEAETGPSATENPYTSNRPRTSAEALRRFEAANTAMERREWPEAVAELEWLVENYPKLSGPSLNMALVYRQQGNMDEADNWFRKTLQINRDNLDAYNQYAIFLREQGRFDEAEKVYLQALARWEQHAATHRNLGVFYDMYRGDQTRALVHLQRYQELTGSSDRTVAGWIVDLQRRQVMLVKGV